MLHSGRELIALLKLKGWRKLCRPSNRIFVIHAGTILSSFVLIVAFSEKVAHPELVIGIDETVTWLFFIGMTFFFMVISAAFGLFVSISIKQEKFGGSKSLVQLLTFSRFLMPFLCMTMWTAFGLVTAAVYARNESVQTAENLIIGFWAVLGFAALMLLISTPLVLHSACRDLDAMVRRHKSDGKAADISRLSKKLDGVRRQSIVRGIINTTMFFVTAFVPQVRYWGPYLIGFQAMIFSIIVLSISTLTSTRSTGSSGSSKTESKSTGALARGGSKETLNGNNDSKEDRTTKEDLIWVDSGPSMFSSSSKRVQSTVLSSKVASTAE